MKVNKGDLIKVVYWAHDGFDNNSILIINMNTKRMLVLGLENDSNAWHEEEHCWEFLTSDHIKHCANGTAVLESYYA